MARPHPDTPVFKPNPTEVVTAVKSLYQDELKPFGRILLRRVGERAATTKFTCDGLVDHTSVPYIDARRLRRICGTCKLLHMETEDGGEYSVLLVGRPSTFVDSSDSNDPFPEELWAQAAAYFEGLSNDMFLPGGRYACAQVLVARRLPFLSGRSLGEVCHFIQLAISKRRVLGYYGGHLVPFGNSETWIKEQCAAWQQPLRTSKQASSTPMRIATWSDTIGCLQEILNDAAGGVIPLSNVKRLFRSRFQLDLNETMLGYTRLLELLQDPRFQNICNLQTTGSGYVVVQNTTSSPEPSCANDRQSPTFVPPWTVCGDLSCLSTTPVVGLVSPTNMMAGTQQTFIAVPAQHFLVPVQSAWEQTCVALNLDPTICLGSCNASTAESSLDHVSSSDDFETREPFPTINGVQRAAMPDGTEADSLTACSDTQSQIFSADLCTCPPVIETDCTSIDEVSSTSSPMSINDVLKSSFFSQVEPPEDNCFVRNTFINIAPLSPIMHDIGLRNRARSVPKDLGSNRNAWAAMHHALLFAPQPVEQVSSKPNSMSSDVGAPIDEEVPVQHEKQQQEQHQHQQWEQQQKHQRRQKQQQQQTYTKPAQGTKRNNQRWVACSTPESA